MSVPRILRSSASVLIALGLALSVLACSLFLAITRLAGSQEIWEKVLAREAIQKRIDSLIISSTGLLKLKPLDENLYGRIFFTLRTEVVDPFLRDLPRVWSTWLRGETNHFDPVIDLTTVRGKVNWMLRQTVRDRLPAILIAKIEGRIEKNFSRAVPASVRMLPLIGVNSNSEVRLQRIRQDFVHCYRVRILVWLIPLVLTVLWFFSIRKKQLFPESLAGLLGGTALMVLAPLTVFPRQIEEVITTLVRLGGGGREWSEVAATAFVALMDSLSLSLGLIAITGISALVLLFVFRLCK